MNEPLQIKWKLFIPWLKSKPKDHAYNYKDIGDCLVCQFVKETHGILRPSVGGTYVRDKDRMWDGPADYPQIPNDLAMALPMAKTVGNLLERLEQ